MTAHSHAAAGSAATGTLGRAAGAGTGARPTGPAAASRFGSRCPISSCRPLAVFIIGLALVPAVFTVIQSFYRVDALDPPTRFTGLGNFRRLFGDHVVLDQRREHADLCADRRRAVDGSRHRDGDHLAAQAFAGRSALIAS